jgi:hypothetical protein
MVNRGHGLSGSFTRPSPPAGSGRAERVTGCAASS